METGLREEFPSKRLWDVAVIGGGAAGSSAAIILARSGCRVIVLETSRYDSFRIGETLPPSSNPMLAKLGIFDSIKSAGHLASPGTLSLWGTNVPYENDFVFSPFGTGWHLDRARFDAMLAQAAADAGAMVLQGCTVASASLQGTWSLIASQGDCQMDVRAGFLVDAAGRASWRGRTSGPREVLDRLVAIVRVVDRSRGTTIFDDRTLIEPCANGWWYSTSIPGDRAVAAFFTDSDLIGTEGVEARWRQGLAQAPYTAARLRDGSLCRLQVFPANSTFVRHPAGDRWLAVGDAISTFDPLSSHGLLHALSSGSEAAEPRLRESRGAIEWAARARKDFESYWRTRQYYYQQEDRWPDSRFWRRRQLAEAPFDSRTTAV